MSHVKKFGMVFIGVVLSILVIAFIPANIKGMIPGLKSIN